MIRVLLFEDNLDFADSIKELIANSDGMEFCGTYSNCLNAVKNVQQHKPQVVLMDIDMPGKNGLDGLRSIRATGDD
ncbi:MAG TPA: response regulator, partial [Bacteroidia bacterium]|nr:response regulator [Bacteroidia bacterium]